VAVETGDTGEAQTTPTEPCVVVALWLDDAVTVAGYGPMSYIVGQVEVSGDCDYGCTDPVTSITIRGAAGPGDEVLIETFAGFATEGECWLGDLVWPILISGI
jgi:hypothetical protein